MFTDKGNERRIDSGNGDDRQRGRHRLIGVLRPTPIDWRAGCANRRHARLLHAGGVVHQRNGAAHWVLRQRPSLLAGTDVTSQVSGVCTVSIQPTALRSMAPDDAGIGSNATTWATHEASGAVLGCGPDSDPRHRRFAQGGVIENRRGLIRIVDPAGLKNGRANAMRRSRLSLRTCRRTGPVRDLTRRGEWSDSPTP